MNLLRGAAQRCTVADMKRYTTGDIAKAVGVRPSTIRAYHSREQMPAPTGHVGSTPYWEPKDIEPWIKDRTTEKATS